jgi:hypothetical protein
MDINTPLMTLFHALRYLVSVYRGQLESITFKDKSADICPDCQMLVILSKAGIQASITVPLDARASASLGSS